MQSSSFQTRCNDPFKDGHITKRGHQALYFRKNAILKLLTIKCLDFIPNVWVLVGVARYLDG